jgi:hypothetical protein
MKKVTGAFIILFSLFLGTSVIEANVGNQLIIINKATNKLAFYENGKLVKVFPVATGRSNDLTPEGTFKIVNKIKNRPYYKEGIPGGDPANPLGDRWLGIDARGTYGTTYAIHGNSNPASIGTYASAGCVRMFDDDVRWLFDQINLYAMVVITNTSKSFDTIAASKNYRPYSELKSVSVDKLSPQVEKTSITVSAKTTDSTPSHYKFLIHDGSEWKTVQDFSKSNQYNWKPDNEGSYRLKVQVKSTNSDKPFDDEKEIPYDIFVPATVQSFNVGQESPAPVNTAISFSTETNNVTNNLVKYSVFNGTEWTTIQDYSDITEISWTPDRPGDYKLKVQTKHNLSGQDFDHEEEVPFTIYEPANIASLTTDKESPRQIDTSIVITGISNDDASNLFKVLLHDGEKWSTLQEYSTGNILSWKPAKPSNYKIKVQAKHELSTQEFDSEKTIDYTVFEPATIQTITSNVKGIQQVNNTVTLTASSGVNQDLEYRFSIFDGEEWLEVQGYSPSSRLLWTPTKPGTYKIRIDVKHKLSNKEYDDAHEVPFIFYNVVLIPAVIAPRPRLRMKDYLSIKGLPKRGKRKYFG